MARPLFVLLAMLALGACARPSEQAARTPVRIAVGGQAQLIYLPATLVQELGYATAENLDVTLEDFPGGAKALEALLGGSVDVVCGFYDHTIQMAAQGRELRAFITMLRYPGLVLVGVSPNVRRIEDLRGKTVGVSSPGSSTHMLVNYLLATHGMKAGEASTAAIGMSGTAVAAVTRATVDAAVMTDPALAVVRRRNPNLRILADTRTAEGVRGTFGVDMYPSVVLYSTASWLAAHRGEAQRLARALHRTLDWMRGHSPEEIRARLPRAFRTEDTQTDLEGLRNLQTMLSPDGRMPPDAPEAVRKVLAVSIEGVRTSNIDLAKTYTNEFSGP
jgi:NitT/TauT family transport system substrate-binding protein